eukprot:1506220-Pleurochrysis_carterae.AAC.5
MCLLDSLHQLLAFAVAGWQVLSRSGHGVEADCWSAGVVALKLLTGSRASAEVRVIRIAACARKGCSARCAVHACACACMGAWICVCACEYACARDGSYIRGPAPAPAPARVRVRVRACVRACVCNPPLLGFACECAGWVASAVATCCGAHRLAPAVPLAIGAFERRGGAAQRVVVPCARRWRRRLAAATACGDCGDGGGGGCLLYTSPSPRDGLLS